MRRCVIMVVAAFMVAAGCSDPAGVARKEAAAARSKSPHPTAPATTHPAPDQKGIAWHQAAGTTKTNPKAGLKVRAGHRHSDRVTLTITDTKRDVSKVITASVEPRKLTVGRYLLSAIKVTATGVGFTYRPR